MKELLIVDSFNILYRAHHVNKHLKASNGFPTGALHGFLKSLNAVKKLCPGHQVVITMDPFPDSVAAQGNIGALQSSVALDDSLSRKQIYPGYKGTRSPMPDDLQLQLWPLVHILQARGYPVLQGNELVEADDIAATIAYLNTQRGGKSVIYSGDKDLASMLQYDGITIYNPNTNSWFGAKELQEKFGVLPTQMTDFLSLMGDAVDNIPGVDKCGEKTAAKWLNQYGTLETLLENADAIKGVVGQKLRESRDVLSLSKKLVQLRLDIPLNFEACTMQKPADRHTLRSLLEQHELKDILKQFPKDPNEPTPS